MKYNKMEKILVMLSTYNGEQYLRQQIDSIMSQEDVSLHLLVRDDGSSDDTLAILNSYKQNYANITILAENNSGAIMSFYLLMLYAKMHFKEYNYFAFSDQDDVWRPNKLKRAIDMNRSGSDSYFYYSCYNVVDRELYMIRKSTTKKVTGTLGEALISNFAIGCSEVFTYKILDSAAKICDYNNVSCLSLPYHDLWVYLVALSIDADIVYDSFCSLDYRQHGSNVIGVNRSHFETLKFQYRNLVDHRNIKSGFAQILLELQLFTPRTHETLALASSYRESLIKRLKLLASNDFRIKDKVRQLAFYYSVITGLF